MQKRDKRMDARTDGREAFYNLPTTAFGHRQEIKMRGIRSYMGWTHIPDVNSGAKTSDDNPFAGPKLQTPGKVLVNLPTDKWLCNKLNKLNITLVQGYPSRTAESGNLQRDQFVRPAKSQSKWYGLHSAPKKDSSDTSSSWNTGFSRINSTYLRIARQAGIASNPPLSRPISQDTLRKCERSDRESSVICNQAAGFNHCLLKVQQNMQTQLRAIRTESKGKAACRVSADTEELQFLLDFNASVCHAMAKSMEHLTDFVFVNMANTTLLRRDSYLSYLKAGVKADTLNALRSAPLQLDTLFPDSVVKQAEDIAAFDKSRSGSVYKKGRYHPYERQDRKSDNKKQDRPAWKNGTEEVKESTSIPHDQPRVGWELHKNTDNRHFLKCKLSCCTFCSYYTRAFPKERIKSWVSRLLCQREQIKICEKCFLCHSIVLCKTCNNVKNAAPNLPVGARLQNYWQTWLDLGAGPKVVQILKEGYTLPFRIWPKLL